MNNITSLTSFFGWCSLLNIAVLLFSALCLALFRNTIKKAHSRFFNVSDTKLDILYFKYLAYYKISLLIFNLIPYIALKLMASS